MVSYSICFFFFSVLLCLIFCFVLIGRYTSWRHISPSFVYGTLVVMFSVCKQFLVRGQFIWELVHCNSENSLNNLEQFLEVFFFFFFYQLCVTTGRTNARLQRKKCSKKTVKGGLGRGGWERGREGEGRERGGREGERGREEEGERGGGRREMGEAEEGERGGRQRERESNLAFYTPVS